MDNLYNMTSITSTDPLCEIHIIDGNVTFKSIGVNCLKHHLNRRVWC